MKLWTLGEDESLRDNFPQIVYKGVVVEFEKEVVLTNEIFKLFYRTHRDMKSKIDDINAYKKVLPYKNLHDMVLQPKHVEFQTEYLVDLLNYFKFELEDLK